MCLCESMFIYMYIFKEKNLFYYILIFSKPIHIYEFNEKKFGSAVLLKIYFRSTK